MRIGYPYSVITSIQIKHDVQNKYKSELIYYRNGGDFLKDGKNGFENTNNSFSVGSEFEVTPVRKPASKQTDASYAGTSHPQRRPAPTAQRPASTTQRPAPTAQRTAPTAQRPAPTAQRPASTAQRPAPTAQRPAPTTQRPAPTTQRPASTEQHPAPTAQHTASTAQRPAPTTQRPASTTQRPASTAQRPAPSVQRVSGGTRQQQRISTAQRPEQSRRVRNIETQGYTRDRAREKRERERDEREREHLERKRAVEEASRFFTKNTKPKNYWINLLIVTFKMLIVCILVIGFSGIGFVLGMSKSYLETVPELDFTLVTEQEQSSVFYDVNGETLGNYYSSENREWATLDEIPDELENAVIAIEDVRFRRHMGIDFKRLFSVLLTNFTSGSMQGGSTITQQLIKNTMLSFEQTYKRKIQEASLALELEKNYSKDQILEAYLNTIYMGGSCYGVKTAAKDYFGKELNELSLRECACLAGLIQNPSRYNPRSNYYTRSNPARTDNRTNLVLYEMKENGLISPEAYNTAKADTFTVLEASPYSTKTGMIYYTDYVIDSVVDEIIEDRGLENTSKNRSAIRSEIRTEGYSIHTTLDAQKQQAAEKAVYDFSGYPSMRYSADSYTVIGRNPDGSVIRLTQPQAAVAAVDYRNGYIVALVGGRQAPNGSLEFNRSYQSTMPVGSSIKPIAVYGPAIEKGCGVGSVYYDYQMKINGWDSEKGYPANNSRTYSGLVTMRRAFVGSLNTSAAQALLYDVGLDDSYNTLIKLGVDPDHISKTGSGLALGSSGIPPLEMAGAFSCIANGGIYIEPIAFTKITDKNGNVIVDMLARQETRRVFTESTAYQITSMMRDVATSNSRTNVPGQTVYGKTGTNSENRGVFFAGFTGYYTGCIWIGSDAYKQLPSNAQGGVYAAPLFASVMKAIHKGLPDRLPVSADVDPASIGVEMIQYCNISGKKATSSCPSTHTDYGNPANVPDCDVHKTVQICSESHALAKSTCPAECLTTATLIMIPQKGALNYMYYNEHSRFVAITGGEPTLNMSSCKVH